MEDNRTKLYTSAYGVETYLHEMLAMSPHRCVQLTALWLGRYCWYEGACGYMHLARLAALV